MHFGLFYSSPVGTSTTGSRPRQHRNRHAIPARGMSLLCAIGLFASSMPYSHATAKSNNRLAEEAAARQLWSAGYVKMESGLEAEKTANAVLALEQFQAARKIFQEVHDQYPDWNPSLISYRLRFVEDRIKRLSDTVESQKETLTKPALVSLVRNQKAELEKIQKELAENANNLRITGEALDRARREAARNAAATDRVDSLLNENRQLKERLGAHEQSLTTMRQELDNLRENAGLKQVTEELRNKLDVTVAKERELQQAADSYRQNLEALRTDLKQATLSREALAQENQRLNETQGSAQKELKEAQKTNRDREKKIATLEKDAASSKKTVDRHKEEQAAAEQKLTQLNKEVRELRDFRDKYVNSLESLGKAQEKVALLERSLDERESNERKMAALNRSLEKQVAALEKKSRKTDDAPVVVPPPPPLPPAPTAQNQETLAKLQELQKNYDRQKSTLADAQKQLTATTALAAQLPEKEKQLAKLEHELKALRQKLEDNNRDAARKTVGIQDLSQENSRLKNAVALWEKRDRQAQEELTRLRQQQTEATGTVEQTKTSLTELQTNYATTLKAKVELEKATADQLQILRRQEQELTELRQAKADLTQALAATQEKKTTTTTETDGAAVADKETNELREKLQEQEKSLQEALTAREYARQQVDEVRQQSAKMEKELAYHKKLATENSRQPGGEIIARLRQDLKEVYESLLKEKASVTALEAALAGTTTELENLRKTKADAGIAIAMPHMAASPQLSEEEIILVRGLLRKAITAEQAGDTEAATWNYKKVLEYDKINQAALQRLGILAAHRGDDAGAEEFLRQAFHQNPDDADTLTTLGFILIRRNSPDLALSMLSRAVALNPRNAEVQRNLGVACSSLGWRDAAEVQFRRSLEINSQDSEAAFNLAVLLGASEDKNRLTEARNLYRQARRTGLPADPQLDEFFEYSE